jgi:phosphatidate phosphatase APP1
MPDLYPLLFRFAVKADAHYDVLSRRVRKGLGIAPPLRILPYRGYGTPERVVIKARVLEERKVTPQRQRHTLWSSAVASYKRYMTREISSAHVAVRWGDKRWEGVTDEEGFLELWVPPPEGVRSGWHMVELELLAPEAEGVPRVSAPVRVAGASAEVGVISDIDDTVIATGVTDPLKRAWALFLTEHRGRLPFPGVDAFYAALQAGASGTADNPIFYVSSSPWNLYEHLDEFLSIHRIPIGPLLLRDWGLSRHGFAPGGGHGHKLDKIRGVLETLSHLPFVLIGDSGQEDAEHYRTIVREYPGRIRCVYIRNVPGRSKRGEEMAAIAKDIRDAGSELVVVDDTVAAARHAARAGWIRWEEVPEVEAHRREDAARSALGERG